MNRMDREGSGFAVDIADSDNQAQKNIPQQKQKQNEQDEQERVISETISAAFNLVASRLSRREFAKWLSDWFQNLSPELLIEWLCLNTQKRREAEANLVTFLNKHTGMFISTKRILRQNRMSRNTDWPKTLEKSSGVSMPTCYYNRVCRQTPNRFLYGAMRWQALKWSSELLRFENGVSDAKERLDKLRKLEAIPVIEQSPVLPFSIRNLMKLHEMGENGDDDARKLEASLQDLRLLERNYCEAENCQELIKSISEKCRANSNDDEVGKNKKRDNTNNLFELLVILKSSIALQEKKWKIIDVAIDKSTSKPIIELSGEVEKTGFGCKISKGGIGQFDLSKTYRGRNPSGFEPDVVYIFYRDQESSQNRDAVIFLGDAKFYTTSGHDGAVCGKLLNIFAFARALGLKLNPEGGDTSSAGSDPGLIQYHHTIDEKPIPIPSFMFFFPFFEDGEERNLRSVTERFSLDCFACDENIKQECQCRECCPGNVTASFERIFELISDENFVWPLRMTKDGTLEFKSK